MSSSDAEAEAKRQQCQRHELWVPGGEGGARTFSAAGAAGAAGVLEKNDVSLVTLASGGSWPDFEAFLMPFGLGTLICVALGLRPAPGRHPPLRPLTPAMVRS